MTDATLAPLLGIAAGIVALLIIRDLWRWFWSLSTGWKIVVILALFVIF